MSSRSTSICAVRLMFTLSICAVRLAFTSSMRAVRLAYVVDAGVHTADLR